MSVISGVFMKTYMLMNAMSPYLMLGFLCAGLIHILIDTRYIGRHLGRNNIVSVLKAALFGIPLPLCSCGVLPAAVTLKKNGASKGAVLSFLISTPTTGLDSIMATYSLLGPIFAIFRIAAAFITGVAAGIAANIIGPDGHLDNTVETSACCGAAQKNDEVADHDGHGSRIAEIFKYAFIDLVDDTGRWILAGTFLGGIIAYFMPDNFVNMYMGSGIRSMAIMMVIGVPMYVCATGSIPIASALMLKGLDPGAALVFLLTGPATNAIGLTVIAKRIGRHMMMIYVSVIVIVSFIMGIILDGFWGSGVRDNIVNIRILGENSHFGALNIVCSLILVILIVFSSLKNLYRHKAEG